MHPQPLTIRSTSGNLTSPARLIQALLGTLLQLQIRFVDEDDVTVVHDPATTGRLVCKAPQDLGGEVILLDASWTANDDETYTLATLADSTQLRALIDAADGDDSECILTAQIEWQLPDEDDPRKSYPFPIEVINSPARSDDTAPDVTGQAASDWLDVRSARLDKTLALTAGQRTQLLTNIGNMMQLRVSDDGAHLHTYTPAGIYKGSLRLLDLGQANLS